MYWLISSIYPAFLFNKNNAFLGKNLVIKNVDLGPDPDFNSMVLDSWIRIRNTAPHTWHFHPNSRLTRLFSSSAISFMFSVFFLQVIKWHNVCSSIHGVMREILLGCEAGNTNTISTPSNQCFGSESTYQCCGSGSTGSTCFWSSWIRIRIH